MNFVDVPVGAALTLFALSTAKSLTCPVNANGVLVQALTQNVRMTYGGTATTGLGFRLAAGDPYIFIGLAPAVVLGSNTLSFIEETPSAIIQYQFVRRTQIDPVQVG